MILITAITKSLVKGASLDIIIIDTLWWYKTWLLSGYNHTRAKQNLPRRPREEPNEVPGADKEAQSHLH